MGAILYRSLEFLMCEYYDVNPWYYFSILVNQMIECEDDVFINECRKLFKKNKYVEDFRPVTINATTNMRIQKFIRSKDPLDLK